MKLADEIITNTRHDMDWVDQLPHNVFNRMLGTTYLVVREVIDRRFYFLLVAELDEQSNR